MQDTEIFLRVLDPMDTSTGGGSAAAISGAMAGALVALVCHLSVSGPAGAETQSVSAIAAQAQELSALLLDGSRKDMQAFQAVRRAYQLPKGSEAERQARSQAVQAAWVVAAQVPLQNATSCLAVATLGLELQGRTNPAARSDLNCAIRLAQAGVWGCLENVATNLPSIKDPALVTHLAQEAEQLRRQVSSLPAFQTLVSPVNPSHAEATSQ